MASTIFWGVFVGLSPASPLPLPHPLQPVAAALPPMLSAPLCSAPLRSTSRMMGTNLLQIDPISSAPPCPAPRGTPHGVLKCLSTVPESRVWFSLFPLFRQPGAAQENPSPSCSRAVAEGCQAPGCYQHGRGGCISLCPAPGGAGGPFAPRPHLFGSPPARPRSPWSRGMLRELVWGRSHVSKSPSRAPNHPQQPFL